MTSPMPLVLRKPYSVSTTPIWPAVPKLGFTFVDPFGAVRTLRAQVAGDALAGHTSFVGTTAAVTGRRTAAAAPRLP